jgi:predicted secreted protein
MSPRVLRPAGSVLALAATAFALGGCGTIDHRAGDWLNANDPTRVADASIDGGRVDLRQGQALVVRLDTAPAEAPMRWELKPLAGKVAVAVPLPDVTQRAGATAAGAPLETAFRFRGLASGTQAVELEYRKPFDPAPGTKTVRFDIVVR